MTGEEDLGEDGVEASVPEGVEWEDETAVPYTWEEWRAVVVPAILVLVLVAVVVLAWSMLRDTGPDVQRLDDIDDSGSFNLLGYYREPLTAYGPHARPVNLTLETGDELVLTFLVNGPPEGIQVRLQDPLHPSDGANSTGGARVHASVVGRDGTLRFTSTDGGAYQVYFWHPGAARPPGTGDDPEAHITAAVAYDLVVVRAHRP